jgi:hypothetical protein
VWHARKANAAHLAALERHVQRTAHGVMSDAAD